MTPTEMAVAAARMHRLIKTSYSPKQWAETMAMIEPEMRAAMQRSGMNALATAVHAAEKTGMDVGETMVTIAVAIEMMLREAQGKMRSGEN